MSNRQTEAPGDRIHLGKDAAKHIDAYFEYSKIVGNDDNGVPFTPQEYERYKKEVLPMVSQIHYES